MGSNTVQHDQPLQEDHIKHVYKSIDEWKKELQDLSNQIRLVKERFRLLAVSIEADTSNEVYTQREKDILHFIQSHCPTMDIKCVRLGTQQTAIVRLFNQAMAEQLRQYHDVQTRCELNERTLGGEIDELTRQKEHCQQQISTLKSKMRLDEHIRSRVAYLEKEMKKREMLINVLNERLRKSIEAARYFDQFDGSNFDEYRRKMQMWQEDEIRLLRKSEEIKNEFGDLTEKEPSKTCNLL